MSDKYIIKNCPALYQIQGMTNECLGTDYQCQDCTDCLMKKIVELCKGELGRVRTIGKDIMAEEILKLLDIEECE